MDVGIFAKTFPRPSLEETLDAVVDAGLATIQFNLALAGGPTLPDRIPAGLARRVRLAVTDRGLRMAAVSGTYNTAHPDAGARADGARRLGELIRAAPALGTGVVTVCTGSRDAADMWRRHPDNATPEAWRDMITSLAAALTVAEEHDVTLAFEPERNNVVHSAPAGRRLVDELASARLKVVLDPANLLPAGGLADQRRTLAEAFEHLGDELVLAHAKDVTEDGTIVPAGQGRLDYDAYVSLLAQAPPVPLILHGLAEDEVAAGVAHVERAAQRAAGSPARWSASGSGRPRK